MVRQWLGTVVSTGAAEPVAEAARLITRVSGGGTSKQPGRLIPTVTTSGRFLLMPGRMNINARVSFGSPPGCCERGTVARNTRNEAEISETSHPGAKQTHTHREQTHVNGGDAARSPIRRDGERREEETGTLCLRGTTAAASLVSAVYPGVFVAGNQTPHTFGPDLVQHINWIGRN